MAKAKHSKANRSKLVKEEDVIESESVVEESVEVEEIEEEEQVVVQQDEDDDDEDDEEDEDDDDYDPSKKNVDEEGNDLDAVDDDDDDDNANDEKVPDYSVIESTISQVRTRSQKQSSHNKARATHIGSFETDERGLVKEVRSSIDVESLFDDLKSGKADWRPDGYSSNDQLTEKSTLTDQDKSSNDSLGTRKIKIETSYAFAGKLVTETKYVDENSAEAKAYLNSTASITLDNSKESKRNSSFVTVIRKVAKTDEEKELRIKLKRPSLIDNFMTNLGKKQKLSTLEKSRLDWASFVDKRKIGDELKIHNKAGFLDTQDFLHRVDTRRDEQYVKARDDDRQRQFILNAAQGK
ncbi:hypothetical protein DFJ63DRAFT_81776 [Scheffersomyces coipomensis]|uniref:uncharacterized protein n=1 Tax=Scheffersomyces coipomensis TaxID=1788519 RepID=UPI00315DA82B